MQLSGCAPSYNTQDKYFQNWNQYAQGTQLHKFSTIYPSIGRAIHLKNAEKATKPYTPLGSGW